MFSFVNTHQSCNAFWGTSFSFCCDFCDLIGYSIAMLVCFMLLSILEKIMLIYILYVYAKH